MPNYYKTVAKATPTFPITILATNWTKVIQGTWVLYIYVTQFLCGWVTNYLGAALDDEIEYQLSLPKGYYNITFLGVKGPNAGIITYSIDGADIQTIDLYAAGVTYNHKETIHDAWIPTSGKHILRIKVRGKNVASTGYDCYMTYLTFALPD